MLNKKPLILLILGVAILFSAIAIAGSIIINEEKTQISNNVKKIEDCQTISWDEEVKIYGTCTKEVIKRICDDEPTNESCYDVTEEYDYKCEKGTKTVEKSKKDCKDNGYIINDLIKLNSKEYNCSTNEENGNVIIICDSKYDGDGDGKCKPGESCMKFVIDGDNVQKYEKNSRYDFVESDKSFFLDRASTEVLR